jgi:hypothetical protein
MTTGDADLIVALLAMDPSPGEIPWNELRETTGNEAEEDVPSTPTLVWTSRVA